MKGKESAEKKQTGEVGIYLLVKPEWESHLIHKLIVPLMAENFPSIMYVVVVIEDGDELNDFAKLLPPRAFVFDEKKSFLWSEHSYSSQDLLSRLISRFPLSQGVLMTGEDLLEEGIHYCLEKNANVGVSDVACLKELEEEGQLGVIGIECLLCSVFGKDNQ